MKKINLIAILTSFATVSSFANIKQIEAKIQKSLDKFCIECHGFSDNNTNKMLKYKVTLKDIASVAPDKKKALIDNVEYQMAVKAMPMSVSP